MTVNKIGFVGAGKLARVLTFGFIRAGILSAKDIVASAPTERDCEEFRDIGCPVTTDNKEVVKENPVVILAVKPQSLHTVVREIAPLVTRNHLIISPAAGVTVRSIQNELPGRSRVARVMTNLAVEYLEGATAFCQGRFMEEEDYETIMHLFSSVGYCFETPERLMDVMTGLVGGGPAYMYLAIEALADGAVQAGVNRQDAIQLAARAVSGAAKMVLGTKLHPGELKDNVCSAGGSTIAGIFALERAGFRGALMDAVKASSESETSWC
ncbi:pyrroline-5-carboxylate reductase 2-like [Xenia sp. Carnegie-2017]|uniref:pyrroline-5-carboxylate reductase 2-like n=1 Tax=Xenia sp. Carnegie-2017 TaxID=2897299 RepID=UPI001F04EC0C|nr:pyrroline-5-carboxylate reductase 2-like [Xenia sp. Carnegie-2017]